MNNNSGNKEYMEVMLLPQTLKVTRYNDILCVVLENFVLALCGPMGFYFKAAFFLFFFQLPKTCH